MKEQVPNGDSRLERFIRAADDLIDRLLRVNSKPDKFYNHWEKTESLLTPDQIDYSLDILGIERHPDRPHILKFVAEVPTDFELEGSPSFEEFCRDHPELIEGKREWIQTYLFTGGDEAIIEREIIDQSYEWPYQRMPDLDKWKAKYYEPISFCYRADPSIDTRYDSKALFWIDDKFGGSASVTITGPQYEGIALTSNDGFIEVNLRDQPVAQIYWNDRLPTELRWSVDRYIRHRILGEPEEGIVTKH